MLVNLHPQEAARIAAAERLNLYDLTSDPRFDALTIEATEKLGVPIATLTVLDQEREIYKSCQGLDQREGRREHAFCGWALLAKSVFVIEDTQKDARFQTNPYVTGPPYIRFYAGMRILDAVTGFPVAVFCIKDTQPRAMTVAELDAFLDIADRAARLINETLLPSNAGA